MKQTEILQRDLKVFIANLKGNGKCLTGLDGWTYESCAIRQTHFDRNCAHLWRE